MIKRTTCTWVKAEKSALVARVSADANAFNWALSSFLELICMMRSVFFQS